MNAAALQVKYREDVQKELSSSLFSSLPQTLQTELAKEVTELQSQVTKKKHTQSQSVKILLEDTGWMKSLSVCAAGEI